PQRPHSRREAAEQDRSVDLSTSWGRPLDCESGGPARRRIGALSLAEGRARAVTWGCGSGQVQQGRCWEHLHSRLLYRLATLAGSSPRCSVPGLRRDLDSLCQTRLSATEGKAELKWRGCSRLSSKHAVCESFWTWIP